MKRLMRTTIALALIFTCFAFGNRIGVAQVEEVAIGNTFGLGARTMGMGGAFLAVADDFTSLYWNPAGLAQIRKFELYGSLSHSEQRVDTKFTRGRTAEVDSSKTRPNSIGLVYPLYTTRGGIAFALGYNRPQNFDSTVAIRGLDPSSDSVFSGLDVDEMTSNSGGIGIWSFGAGVFISDSILLGGSIDFWHGSSFNELDSAAADINNIDPEIDGFAFQDSVDRVYSGLGGRVGVLAFAGENVTLGGTVTLPVDLEVSEVWEQITIVEFDDGEGDVEGDDGSILFDIERPFEFGGGIAIKLLEKRLRLAGDVQFTDWTQTEYDPLPAEDAQNNFNRYYDSTIQVRVGAEYRIPVIETSVRVGYFRDPIPFQDREIDSDRDFLTVGVGKIFDRIIKIDIAYMRGSWEQSSNLLAESQTSNRVFVSAGYRY
jgi:long-subunit fatty acid transport protein